MPKPFFADLEWEPKEKTGKIVLADPKVNLPIWNRRKYPHMLTLASLLANEGFQVYMVGSMSDVISSIIFFYNLGIDLSSVMMNSLQPHQQKELQQRGLLPSGVGINHYTHSLKEILEDLKIYPN